MSAFVRSERVRQELDACLQLCAELDAEVSRLRKQKAEVLARARALFAQLQQSEGISEYANGKMRIREVLTVDVMDAVALHRLYPTLVETRFTIAYTPDKTRLRLLLERSPEELEGIACIRKDVVVERQTRGSVAKEAQS